MSNSKQNIALNEQVLDYSFGMPMPGRSYTSENYRFGFGGGEKINAVYGSGNYVDLGERGVDTRLGRLNWKTDRFEKDFAFQSPYVFAGNSVIMAIDINGDSTFVIHAKKVVGTGIEFGADATSNTYNIITSSFLLGAGTLVGMIREGNFEDGGPPDSSIPNWGKNLKELNFDKENFKFSINTKDESKYRFIGQEEGIELAEQTISTVGLAIPIKFPLKTGRKYVDGGLDLATDFVIKEGVINPTVSKVLKTISGIKSSDCD